MSARRGGRGRITARVLVAGLAVALGLTACAQLPSDGPVRTGQTEAPAAGPFRYDASRPSPGTQPTELVQGFIQAGAARLSGDNDFEVARTFLTPATATQWAPLSQVLVAANDEREALQVLLPAPGEDASEDETNDDAVTSDDAMTPGTELDPEGTEASDLCDWQALGAGDGTLAPGPGELAEAERVSVVVHVAAVGGLDESGAYTPVPNRVCSELAFGLVRVEGEWRIESLPEGLLLTEGTFATVFRAVPLAFLSPEHDMLVPDVRYVPARRASRYAVDHLLDGPVPWLADAVDTAVPDGLRVDPGQAIVIDETTGHAEVHLTGADVPADVADLLYAQLRQTLVSIPSVWSVTVWFGSTPYEPPADTRLPEAAPGVGTTMVALSGGRLVLLTSDDIVDHPGFTPLDPEGAPGEQDGSNGGAGATEEAAPDGTEPSATDTGPSPEEDAASGIDLSAWRAPTLAYGSEPDAAVVVGSELVVLTWAGERRVLARGEDLLAPSFDRFDWVWSGTGGQVLAAPSDGGDPVPVPVVEPGSSTPADSSVIGVRVSRDGARVLLTRRVGEETVVSVHGVVRDDDAAPASIGPGVPLAAFDSAVGAVWGDSTTAVTLGSVAEEGPVLVRTSTTSGPTLPPLSATAQPVWVAAGDGTAQVFVATSDGRLLTRAATRGWTMLAEDISYPSFPG
ncbi:LpqB family beta-propeller domain-containing protein [Salana multivorans]